MLEKKTKKILLLKDHDQCKMIIVYVQNRGIIAFSVFFFLLFNLFLLAEAEGTRRSMASQRQQVRRIGCLSILVAQSGVTMLGD
jgi:hypothetical protein